MKTKFHHNLKFDTTQSKIEKFICKVTIILKLHTKSKDYILPKILHINSCNVCGVWFCTKIMSSMIWASVNQTIDITFPFFVDEIIPYLWTNIGILLILLYYYICSLLKAKYGSFFVVIFIGATWWSWAKFQSHVSCQK